MTRTILSLVICMFFLHGCRPDEAFDEDSVEIEYYNRNIPKDNSIVADSELFGNDNDYSEFRLAELSGDGGFYVAGKLNSSQASTNVSVGVEDFEPYNDPVLIKFSSQGIMQWEVGPGFYIHRILVVPGGDTGGEELVVVTGHDNNDLNDPDDPDRNRIMIFSEFGEFITQHEQDFFLNLWDVKVEKSNASAVKFVGVGDVLKSSLDNHRYPGFFWFEYDKSKREIFSVEYEQLLDEKWRDLKFYNLEKYNDDYIVSGMKDDRKEIHVLSVDKYNISATNWWKYSANDGNRIYHFRGNLHLNQSNAYLTGYLEDDEKEQGTNGALSTSAYVWSLSCIDGDRNWYFRYQEVDDCSDRIHDSQIYDNRLYCSGISSRWYCSGCDNGIEHTVGNAWITKLNIQTGTIESTRTVGDSTLRNNIRQFLIDGNNFWGFGKEQVTNQRSKAWKVKVDRSKI